MNEFTKEALYHHGVMGMKWGVWNDETRLRYAGGKRHIQDSTKKNVKSSRTANVEKWGVDSKHNVLFITGLSGSGKSTVAEGLRDKNTNVIHLDFYTNAGNNHVAKGHRDKDFDQHLEKEVPDFFEKYNGEFPELSKLSPNEKKEFWNLMDRFQEAIISFGQEQYGNKKVIVEGVQIADDTLFFDKTFFKDQPVMILSTDIDTSLKRAADRDGIRRNDKEAMHVRKIMQDKWSKYINKLEQTTSAKIGSLYVQQMIT